LITCSIVASTSVVSVVVIVWHTMGCSDPIGTSPTMTVRVGRRSVTPTSSQYCRYDDPGELAVADATARWRSIGMAAGMNAPATAAAAARAATRSSIVKIPSSQTPGTEWLGYMCKAAVADVRR